MPRRRRSLALTLGVVPALLVLVGCGGTVAAAPTATAGAGGFHGTEPDRPIARPDFVLTDTDGQRYDFTERTAGRPTLVYFGYTNCPDECPTAMATVSAALRQVPQELREQTVVVFVGTDAERDTPGAVRQFLDQFDGDYVGLVGTEAEVQAATRAAGTSAAVKQGPLPTLPGRPDEHEHASGTAPHEHFGPLGYGVGHVDAVYAYGGDQLQVVYPGSTQAADIVADLPRLADPGAA